VADDVFGLRVVSIAEPTAPVEVGYYDTPGSAYAVAVSGQNHELVFVAEGDAGLDVLTSCQAPLLHNGFESGDTSAWSFVAP
jgi:hypothetical protein